MVVPIGGGGLAAGVSAAVKLGAPNVKVVGVEPVGAAAMKASIDAGAPVTLPRTESVADGLMPVRPGDLTYAHVRQFADAVITVEDDEIVKAVLWIFANAPLVAHIKTGEWAKGTSPLLIRVLYRKVRAASMIAIA